MDDEVWTITGGGGGPLLLSAAGVDSLSGQFVVNGPSRATARIVAPYDAPETAWAPDSLVTISREGMTWFQGRVVGNPVSVSAESEGFTIELVDEWASLDQVIYTEKWLDGTGVPKDYPRIWLGVNELGARITTGAQISLALDYAIGRGVQISKGSIPTGEMIWPSRADSLTCAQVIRQSMQFHPDWIAYLDHSTAPPTFNIVKQSSLIPISHAPEECESFEISPLIDHVPLGVDILYETAYLVDETPYRNIIQDSAGNIGGRRVLRAVVDLQGTRMQFQKSRVQTLALPTDAGDAVAYLRKKFPDLAGGTTAGFTVESFTKEMVTPDAEADVPQAVNPHATRLIPSGLAQLPRELVKGSIEDWMRVRTGQVRMEFTLKANETAPKRVKDMVAKLNAAGSMVVTATDAQTKLYHGVTQWAAGDEIPAAGLADRILAAASTPQYTGHIQLVDQDCRRAHYCGTKAMVGGTGGSVVAHEWTMATGETRISIGPSNQMLSPADFVELQRMVNTRPPDWISAEERTSNTLGARDKPGTKGDTVAGFEHPATHLAPGTKDSGRFRIWAAGGKVYVGMGAVVYRELLKGKNPKDDDYHESPVKLAPIVPTLGGQPLSESAPLSYSLSSRSGGSIYVITRSTKCFDLDAEDGDPDPERVEIRNRGEAPDLEDGFTSWPIADFDVVTDNGVKGIDNVTVYRASDIDVPYICHHSSDDDGSGGSGASHSGGGTSSHHTGGSSSHSHPDHSVHSASSRSHPHHDPDPPPMRCCPDDMLVTVTVMSGCIPLNPSRRVLKCIVTATPINGAKCPECFHTIAVKGKIGTTTLTPQVKGLGDYTVWPPDADQEGLVEVTPVTGCAWIAGYITYYASKKTGADPACEDSMECTFPFWFRCPETCGSSSCSNENPNV